MQRETGRNNFVLYPKIFIFGVLEQTHLTAI